MFFTEPLETQTMNKIFTCILTLTAFLFFSSTIEAQKLGAPRVRIRVAQYENSLEFSLPKGGRWLSNNRSGNIPAGQKCKIVGQITQKAVKKFHVMVGSAPADDQGKIDETMNKFVKLGYKTHGFTVGRDPQPGFPDNRIVFVGVGIFHSEEEAQKLHEQLAAQNISNWVFTETIEPAKGQLKLFVGGKEVAFKFAEIHLEGRGGVKLHQAEYAKGFSWHGFADRTYKSRVEIRFGSDDCLDCIEHTDLESLLVGIVPSEISAKAAPAALQAQATAARGEMLSKMGTRHFNEGFEFCSEQHCQVYKGIQSCDDYIYESIRNTWGILLFGDDGKALDAVYSANCGGHSSANQNIWTSNPNPHLQGVADTISEFKADLTDEKQVAQYIKNPPKCWCAQEGVEGANKFRWEKEIDTKAWKKIEEGLELGRIKSIDGFVRDVSGRIISLKISGEKGEKTIMKELAIRKLFGMLRSSCFMVVWHRDQQGFINGAGFTGAGWGHGVGMCQTGAQSMAINGKTYQQILLHYFPGARLKSLY